MRQYAAFLASEGPEERVRRAPFDAGSGGPLLELRGEEWALADRAISSWARKYVPVERELEIPVYAVRWFDALAYCGWIARTTGLPFRLPTVHEWEKAMRGADGRPFPMGTELDPSFAKIRNSRPEGTQPEPVGAFPLDESPHGVRDLAGGIADWTSTMVDGGSAPSLADEGDPEVERRQAYYVGGHWGTLVSQPPVQAGLKQRNNAVGFRLALSLEPGRSSSLTVEPLRR
jgi:formylglycine-generating enzyme required for sulfatase activity